MEGGCQWRKNEDPSARNRWSGASLERPLVGVVYALGVLVLAYFFRLFVAPDFQTPIALEVCVALLAVGLVVLALVWTASPYRPLSNEPVRNAPTPWLVGFVAFLAAGTWFGLLDLPHAVLTGTLVLVPMTLGVVLAAGMAALIRRWSAPGRQWSDLHSLALVFWGAVGQHAVGFSSS